MKNADWIVARQVVLRQATEKGSSTQIVRQVVAERVDAFLALKLRGPAVLPPLIDQLREPSTRARALKGIVMFDVIEKEQVVAISTLATESAADSELRFVAELLLALRDESYDSSKVREIEARIPNVATNLPEIYLALGAFGSGKHWGLVLCRERLRQFVKKSEHHAPPEVGTLLGAFILAARHHRLPEEDRDLLINVQRHLADEDADALKPVFSLIWYFNSGRTEAALDQLLTTLGTRHVVSSRFQWAAALEFGDWIWDETDIGALLSRARDDRASDDVHVGAIRLLAFAGSTSAPAQKILLQQLEAGTFEVRLEAARALGVCVMQERSSVKILQSAMSRESSPEIAAELRLAVKRQRESSAEDK